MSYDRIDQLAASFHFFDGDAKKGAITNQRANSS
jgi:hypothetical protein